MNKFNLPQGLLDSVTNVLKTNPRDNTPLQEKLIKANQSAVKATTDFDRAVSAVVVEARKAEAAKQAKFAQSAAKAHQGMGKSIVEAAETKQEVVKEQFILDESAFVEIATRMKNVGSARRMQNMTEQKETIAQITRTFAASFDQIVEANVSVELRGEEAIQEALQSVKADIRTQMLNAVNVASAARVVDESAKIMSFISVQEALKGKQHKIDANKNGKIDAHDFEVLRARKARGQGEAVDEGMHPMPQNNDKADSRHSAVMAHAKKMGYNVHHEEHYGDQQSGNKGSPDITIHYQRGDDRKSASPEAIEIHKSGKAAGDTVLKSHVMGKAVNEGWDDMLADVKAKKGPQPSGGAGVKKGKRYGGAAQKNDSGEEKEDKEVKEGVMSKVKSFAKKALERVGGGSDKDHLDRLKNSMYGKDSELKYAVKTIVKHAKDPLGLKKEEVEHIGEYNERPGSGSIKKNFGSPPHPAPSGKKDVSVYSRPSSAATPAPKTSGSMKTKDPYVPKYQVVKHLIGTSMDPRYTHPNNSPDMNKDHTSSKKRQEFKDTPGNSYQHQCALHVKHSKLGEGKTLYSQHAQPDADGNIAWYDVMFEEGIKRVHTTDLEILVSESHMNHKKKSRLSEEQADHKELHITDVDGTVHHIAGQPHTDSAAEGAEDLIAHHMHKMAPDLFKSKQAASDANSELEDDAGDGPMYRKSDKEDGPAIIHHKSVEHFAKAMAKEHIGTHKESRLSEEMMNEDEVHNTKPYSLNKQSFNDGMKYSSGESGTIHKDDSHHAKETEAGASSTSDNIVYGIHDKNKGAIHGVSISMSKKTTPEKVAKAAGHDSVLPVHKAISNHHNKNNYIG